MITEAMNMVRANGEWEKLMTPIYHEYVDWQP